MINRFMLVLLSCIMIPVYCLHYNPAIHVQQHDVLQNSVSQPTQAGDPKDEDDDKECPVCSEFYDKTNHIRVRFDCAGLKENNKTHDFCHECALKIAKSKPVCPLCRDTLRLNRALRINNGTLTTTQYDANKLSKKTKDQLSALVQLVPISKKPVLQNSDERPRAAPPSQIKQQSAQQERVRPGVPLKGLYSEFIAALIMGSIMSQEFKKDLSDEQKEQLKIRRSIYIPSFLCSNAYLNRSNARRSEDWRTFALWAVGLVAGFAIPRHIPQKETARAA